MSDLPAVRRDAALALPQSRTPLSRAMEHIKLEVKPLGPDITHGTEFYTPIVTLLARNMGTRRQDLVYQAWPILCCPFLFFSSQIPDEFELRLFAFMANPKRQGKPAVLWEILDLLQAYGKWKLPQLIEWVKAVEAEISRATGLMDTMQAVADEVVRRHDREGIPAPEPQLNEGIVIPVDGPGRVA